MAIVGDINNFAPKVELKNSTMRENAQSLGMNDFLRLLAVQMSNQDMSNPMSETDMMNQMVQMATVQAMNTFTDVATTTYAASLVGKEVTVAHVDGSKIKEVVGTVTGAGLYSGEQIIFVDGVSYKLSSLMAVGKLPEKKEDKPPVDGDGDKDDGETGGKDPVNPPVDGGETGGTTDPVNPPVDGGEAGGGTTDKVDPPVDGGETGGGTTDETNPPAGDTTSPADGGNNATA